MRITLGYPSVVAERALFEGKNPRALLETMDALVDKGQLTALQDQVEQVKASAAILDYLQRLVAVTREDATFHYGLSPRGALAWLRAAKAWALIHDRGYVIPEDIQAVLPSVVGHRVRGEMSGQTAGDSSDLCDYLRNAVDVLK